jgi:hypothetical protein
VTRSASVGNQRRVRERVFILLHSNPSARGKLLRKCEVVAEGNACIGNFEQGIPGSRNDSHFVGAK